MNGITVKQLYEACAEQIKKGNGDKVVQISQDDEGNGFHTLFYLFTDEESSIKEFMFHDDVDTGKIVLLG